MKRRVALLVMLAVVTAGCSSAAGAIDGPVLTSRAQMFGPSGGMAAEVTGVLLFDESTNCLLIELEGVQYSVVWPAGTRWQEDPPAVVLEDGETVEPGMTVYGGGGYLQPDRSTRRSVVQQLSSPAVAEAAERCAGPTGEIAFFNIESEVDVLGG